MGNLPLQRFYSDIIVTAVEGGIGYWSRAYDYTYSDETPTKTKAILVDVEEAMEALDAVQTHWNTEWLDKPHHEGDPRLKDITYTLRIQLIHRAFSKIFSQDEIKYAPKEWRDRMHLAYLAQDAGDIDAGDADMIVQIAIFGEVVYG